MTFIRFNKILRFLLDRKRNELNQTRMRMNIIIGVLGGIAYAVFAWGVDGYLLQMNNGSVPWLKLVIGTPIVILLIIAAVIISTKTSNLVFRSLIWMSTATILCLFVSLLSFQGSEFSIKFLFPNIADQINYILPESIRGRLFVILVMSIILFFIGGLFVEPTSDALFKSSGIIGWVLPLILCITFFGGAGYVADANFNFQLRDQVVAINQQIKDVSKINTASITERQERLIRRFTKLNLDLNGPRRLLVGSFDQSFSQSVILINFDGIWAHCTSLNGLVGNCERITE